MTDLAWLAQRAADGPPGLQARAVEYLALVPAADGLPARLAAAARLALTGVLAQGEARVAALDLLTADTLITLALLAQAERAPAELARFAAEFVGVTAA